MNTAGAFPYCHKKATQALNFFAIKNGGTINRMKALKLVFFADRKHFREYGRPIIGDKYMAMKFGPVASGVKNIAEHSDFTNRDHLKYAERFVMPGDRHMVASRTPADLDEFSKSDLAALEWSWAKLGNKSQFDLSELTHRYPEWTRHETRIPVFNTCPMDYEDFLHDPAGVDELFAPIPPEKREAIREMMREYESAYESLCR